MRQKALLSLSFVVILTQCTMTEQNPAGEPLAKSVPFEMTTHGDTRVDEYYWMRDRENPEVIEYRWTQGLPSAPALTPPLPCASVR